MKITSERAGEPAGRPASQPVRAQAADNGICTLHLKALTLAVGRRRCRSRAEGPHCGQFMGIRPACRPLSLAALWIKLLPLEPPLCGQNLSTIWAASVAAVVVIVSLGRAAIIKRRSLASAEQAESALPAARAAAAAAAATCNGERADSWRPVGFGRRFRANSGRAGADRRAARWRGSGRCCAEAALGCCCCCCCRCCCSAASGAPG